MASVTIILTGVCSGGNHLTVTTSGAINKTLIMETSEVLGSSEDWQLELVIRALVRLAKIGRTMNQVKTLFQNGVTVTV